MPKRKNPNGLLEAMFNEIIELKSDFKAFKIEVKRDLNWIKKIIWFILGSLGSLLISVFVYLLK